MSCDTFVALPPATNGPVIFGKNSDRPPNEVQEVIQISAGDHGNGSTLQCTYIEIPQVAHTYAVVLSKPAWMWGAEMGANEHGVCIGNEAVWTKMASEADKEEKLLGMDLVRLGLERGGTAREAVDIITTLLAAQGQGGPCYEDAAKLDIIYHNSFIITDGTEAWVLETASTEWVAQKVTAGTRNLSNLLTVGSDYQLSSPALQDTAKAKGLWSGDGDLNFAEVFGSEPPTGVACPGAESPTHRYTSGKQLLESSSDGGMSTAAMMGILRDEESGICRLGGAGSATMGSQVSVLYPPESGKPSCHWFTATPNPARSVFKPFIFTPDNSIPSLTQSPKYDDDPARKKPRFQHSVDREHALYKAHQLLKPLDRVGKEDSFRNILIGIEECCVSEVDEFISTYDKTRESELDNLFSDAVETEMKFYSKFAKA